MACVLHRYVREGWINREQALSVRHTFLESVDEGTWTLIPVSEGILRAVNALIPELPGGVFLRAGDAIHLVTASQAGFPEVWTNDRHLLRAAQHLGLAGRSV
jgi:predicted nucleic acid-binding protein